MKGQQCQGRKDPVYPCKIDFTICKKHSRCLAYIRQLKSYGVSVYFEREKLDTGSAVSEFLLSIFAASAQEEIISLSNNMKVGRRMRSAAGIVQWTHVYGYRCIEGGQWAIEPNEAEVVRRIFEEYASGRSLPEICKGLEADGIPSTGNKSNWIATSVADMNRVGRQDRSALALVADYVNLRSVFLIQLQDSTHKGINKTFGTWTDMYYQ